MSHSTIRRLKTGTTVVSIALLALCLYGCPPVTIATGTLQFINNTSYSCTAFYASPSTNTNWGSSVLSSWVASGSTQNITNIPASTLYDFRAVFSNGSEAQVMSQTFAAGETRSWTLTDGNLTAGGPTQTILDLEQAAFDAINLERVNAVPTRTALIMRNDMRLVARAHSEDMAANDFFAHVNLAGQDPFDRMAAAGITYTSAAENIAWSTYPSPVPYVVDDWMLSTGHRTNILNANYTHTGMGVAVNGTGKYYFTQVFLGGSKSGAEAGELKFLTFSLPAESVSALRGN
ncbi:MAG: hypothetical protein GWP08_00400 [Nitrospiraceae bacterium]|nr:hypothetical protein [Nitrospiraceae bacterium]